MTLQFSKNFLSEGKNTLPVFDGFQADSEYLVFSEIYQNKVDQKDISYGLATLTNEKGERVSNIWDLIKQNTNEQGNIKTIDYTSQFGLQGHIFSFIYHNLHIPFWLMKLVICIALAIILVMISYFIYKKYGVVMGSVFYITFLLSPWVVSFAKNLYWVEFTWFLPMLFGLLLSMNYKKKRIWIPCIFGAIMIKSLCGYEYISTIMLSTISFFIFDFLFEKDKKMKIEILKTTIIVGITCVIAFVSALLIHASIRGNGDIGEGVKDIYKYDILRRTIIATDKDAYTGVYKESMDAGILETISKYFSWDSDIILGIDGVYFKLIFVSTVAILIYQIIKKKQDSKRDSAMFLVFLMATISWYVLGKSHSYIHTHMNFVLWYFGFIQICIYVIICFISQKGYEIGNKIKEGEKNI